MKIKYHCILWCDAGRSNFPENTKSNTEITVIDENSLSVDGELFEFSITDVEWPDMYKQSDGIFFEAHRENGELYLTVRRFTEGTFINNFMQKEEWDTGEYQ